MPTTLPALRGKFGSTEYWLTTMRVGELTRNVVMPKDLPGWEDLSLEARFQREVNTARVRKEIAPYFADDPNRFSGSLVLAIYNPENIAFESLSDFSGGKNVPQLYQSASRDMGFLTLSGEEMLVPIDGQHRAKAFEFAMTGIDDNGKPLPGIRSNTALAQDQASVVLMRFETGTSRLIFNKINRYAKPTTKSDKLITDDDDAVAVITRQLVGEGRVLPARLVRLRGNTLPQNAPDFIPLATFYEANVAIANELPGTGKPQNMKEEQRDVAAEEIRKVWEALFTNIDLFAVAIRDSSPDGDVDRIRVREETLLGKPIAQLALVHAFLHARNVLGLNYQEICERLNRIDWRVGAAQWRNVLIAPNGRVMSGRTTVRRAALFIAHLAGAQLLPEEERRLLESIHGTGWEDEELPRPVV